jgi:hypothetical protein
MDLGLAGLIKYISLIGPSGRNGLVCFIGLGLGGLIGLGRVSFIGRISLVVLNLCTIFVVDVKVV